MDYDVTRPRLSITIIEPYSIDLMPISSVGKSSLFLLKHSVIFVKKSNQHKLEIIGKYQKDIYLDGQHYGSVWSGSIVIKDGVLTIDNEPVSPSKI